MTLFDDWCTSLQSTIPFFLEWKWMDGGILGFVVGGEKKCVLMSDELINWCSICVSCWLVVGSLLVHSNSALFVSLPSTPSSSLKNKVNIHLVSSPTKAPIILHSFSSMMIFITTVNLALYCCIDYNGCDRPIFSDSTTFFSSPTKEWEKGGCRGMCSEERMVLILGSWKHIEIDHSTIWLISFVLLVFISIFF